MMLYEVSRFGAMGDGLTDDTAAIQAAIDLCHREGGGRVVFGSGRTFRSGSLHLRSHVELHLERGSVLQASGDIADHVARRRTSGLSGGRTGGDEGSPVFILAESCQSLAITGAGAIDGGGRYYRTQQMDGICEMTRERPYTVFFWDCDNVLVQDITIRDAAFWTLRLSGCRDSVISRLTIRNDPTIPNNDGIDIDTSQRIKISDCDIVTGDDGICIKACSESRRFEVTEDIVVTGCNITSASSALCIGSEVASPIRNCLFRACTIRGSNRGLSLQLAENGGVSRVMFADIVVETQFFDHRWWGCGEPIYISAYPWRSTGGYAQDIHFRNILARSESGILVRAEEAGYLRDVTFERVRVELDRWSGRPGGFRDLRPHPEGGPTSDSTDGFRFENVTGLRLSECEVSWSQPPPVRSKDFRHALKLDHVSDVCIDEFVGESADPDQWTAIERNGSDE